MLDKLSSSKPDQPSSEANITGIKRHSQDTVWKLKQCNSQQLCQKLLYVKENAKNEKHRTLPKKNLQYAQVCKHS